MKFVFISVIIGFMIILEPSISVGSKLLSKTTPDTHQTFAPAETIPVYQLELPIDNPREAIEHARPYKLLPMVTMILEKQNLDVELYASATRLTPNHKIQIWHTQLKNNIINQETFNTLRDAHIKQGDYWRVTYKTKNIIPSFSCHVLFKPDGTELQKPVCQWNK